MSVRYTYYGSAAPAFNPLDLNPDFYWVGDTDSYVDAGLTLCTEGQDIEQFGASSDTHVFNATAKPVWKDGIKNGHAVARFDGSTNFLGNTSLIPSPQTNQARTTAFVFNSDTFVGNGALATWDGAGTATYRTMRPIDSTADIQVFIRGDSGTGYNVRYGAGSSAGNWYIIIAVDTGFFLDIYINGVISLVAQNSSLASARTYTDVFLGKGRATSQFFDGDIAEIFIKEGTITSSEVQDYNTYLTDRYAI